MIQFQSPLLMMMVKHDCLDIQYYQNYCIVGVRVRFKKTKYFITEGDGPLELCLEKLGTTNDAVTVAVSSSDGSAIGKTV